MLGTCKHNKIAARYTLRYLVYSLFLMSCIEQTLMGLLIINDYNDINNDINNDNYDNNNDNDDDDNNNDNDNNN